MESTLALRKSDFMEKTGAYLGWGRGADNGETAYTTAQKAMLKDFVDTACRQFYWPALDGGASYDWTFLKPVATLPVDLGAVTLALPDDFGGMEGELSIASASTPTQSYLPLPFVPVGMVYNKAAEWPDLTGCPQICCEEPIKGTGFTKGQRMQLRFFPTADQAYTVKFQYYLLPDCLSTDHPYAYGGAAHADTILEGCKAAAELALDDQMGVHRAMFKERLLASVAQDRRLKPQRLAYNGDRSDDGRDRRSWRQRDSSQVTFDGVAY